MEIRRAAESDIDAIVELNRQIGLMHFEHVPQVFC
ncbi:GNAT family N-acetyltransferase, partial [Aeromonas salmonicida]